MNYIVEITKDSHEHELVNSCALYIWQDVFKQQTQFFGTPSHKQALEEFLPELTINRFHALGILPKLRGNKMQWIKIYLNEFSSILKIFKKAKQNKVSNVVFLSITPFALLFAKCYLKCTTVKFNVIFTFHGELQFLIQEDLRLSERLLQFITKINLSFFSKNSFYIVYGATIKEKLKKLYPKVDPQVVSLEHPFNSKGLLKNIPVDLFIIGAFGAISKHKNAHKIVDLAATMSTIIPQLHFKFVGKFIDPIDYKTDNITVVGGDEFLSRIDYEREISSASWLIYLYEDRNYELIASGAFLDAILYNKPIICLRNKFFEHVFQEYKIGIMVDSISSLPVDLRNLFARPDLQQYYLECQENIKRYMNDYQLINQGAILGEKLNGKLKF